MPRTTWTHELRKRMFERVRERFGAKGTWTAQNYPRRGRKDEYDRYLDALAVELREPTGNPELMGTALDQQIKFSFSNRKITNQSNYRSMVLNAAAALEAGFLTIHDLPGEASMDRDDEGA